MKKIYLKPEMELTECFMLRTAICSNPATEDIDQPNIPSQNPPVPTGAAPRRVF